MQKSAEIDLVRKAKAGDKAAFEMLYRLYSDRIYNFSKQITGTYEDAADITQDTFIRAWKSLPRLRAEETFGTWLHRIALNRSKDAIAERKKAPLRLDEPSGGDPDAPRLDPEDPSPGPDARLAQNDKENAVRLAIDSLSPDHRLVVTMHHMDGMEVGEIAGILGISKGTVMSRLSRAREALRRKLAAHIEVG
jgi:RNA polymerase sigma-70 factor (ECF subfamily)